MRVLHICARSPTINYGLSLYVKKLSKSLRETGINIEILSTNPLKNYCHIKKIDGIKVNYLKSFFFKIPISLINHLNPFINLFPFLKKNYSKYDIVHIHSFSFISSLMGILTCKFLRIPTILTLHGGVNQFIYSPFPPFKMFLKFFISSFYFIPIGYLSIRNVSVLISVSKSDIELIRKVFGCHRKHRNYWIPNGIEITKYHNQEYDRKYITFIGRLDKMKGFDIFIKIMRKLNLIYPNIPIMVIGKGKLESLIVKSELNIKHFKSIPHEKIHNYYLQSKMFINSSLSEGLSTTIIEAMNYGVPIVGSNIRGINDLIIDEFNGFLFDLNNINEGVKKIDILLKNRELRENFVKRSLQSVKKYSWDRIIIKHINLYNSIITKI